MSIVVRFFVKTFNQLKGEWLIGLNECIVALIERVLQRLLESVTTYPQTSIMLAEVNLPCSIAFLQYLSDSQYVMPVRLWVCQP